MTAVCHFRKVLGCRPDVPSMAGVAVRPMAVPEDIARWLALRERAIAGLGPAPPPGVHADYEAEMFDTPWWQAERNWLAMADVAQDRLIGAVTLAVRAGATGSTAVVHWLLVDPAWRRRGVGRLLMSHLERAAWDAGWREVELETHAGWTAAVAFYQSMGYAPVRALSPR